MTQHSGTIICSPERRTAVTVPSSSAARSEESEGSLKIQRPSSTLVSMTMRGKVGTTVSIGVNRRSAVTPRPSETAQELYLHLIWSLVLEFPGLTGKWAIEIKRGLSAKPQK